MSIDACAQLVERGDPDRFLATMAAPPKARALLFPLYAFNLEVARAPWVTAEPLIAEMRLQWWRDVLDEIASGAEPRAHEVAAPLTDLIRKTGLPVELLQGIIDARRWDISGTSFSDETSLLQHLDQTGGNLMWAAALVLGAKGDAERPVRDMARAAALVAWFRAVPALKALGRSPLPDESPGAIAELAQKGLAWVAEAQSARASVPKAISPAMFPAWQTKPLLKRVVKDPSRVIHGQISLPEIARRGRLLVQSISQHW